jgi:hypothetical protein
MKTKRTKTCEIDHIDLRIRMVTITSYRNFADAFTEAAKQIKADDLLWDIKINRSAAGCKLQLCFLESADDANDIPRRAQRLAKRSWSRKSTAEESK